MNTDWKYVLMYFPIGGYVIIIFPPVITHAEVARGFPGATPESAGFLTLDEFGKDFICYGKSDSLRLSSKPGDAVYANKLLRPPE